MAVQVQERRYAGIGSRETPADMCQRLEDIAYLLALHQFILHTGRARGADQAFMRGALKGGGWIGAYLPVDHFEGNGPRGTTVIEVVPTDEQMLQVEAHIAYAAVLHAAGYDPRNWTAGRGLFIRRAFARDVMQILSSTLDHPVNIVICWAPLSKQGKIQGGTRIACAVAEAYEIPVFNLADPVGLAALTDVLGSLPPLQQG
jgi:hypothetical protein